MSRAQAALILFGLGVPQGCSCGGPLPDLDAGSVGVGDAGGDDVTGERDGGEHDAGGGTIDAGGGTIDAGGSTMDAGAGADGGQIDDGGPDLDAGASDDAGGPVDSGAAADGGSGDDAGAGPDAGAADAVCGNGFRELDESCDDGVTGDCASTHDDGAGVCVGGTSCATDYVWTGDACVAAVGSADVTIYVNNFCEMTVVPQSITVPAGQSVNIDWHNASVDYPVDIWLSYGGGYLDLPTGATWDEPIVHCGGINPHTEYADISTACSDFRFFFHCE